MVDLSKVERLWSEALATYSTEVDLLRGFPGDRNVAERINFDLPPTFQPGYVGAEFSGAPRRLVFLGQNPGGGASPEAKSRDRAYAAELRSFAAGSVTFQSLCDFIHCEISAWGLFKGKGIFSDLGAERGELLPPELRPALEDVAYLNAFPFKTHGNKMPFKGDLHARILNNFVVPVLVALDPHLIVRFPAADDAASAISASLPQVNQLRVWHPSDYNFNAQFPKLSASWRELGTSLHPLA